MKRKYLILIVLSLILAMPLISSRLVFKQNTLVDLKLPCTFNGTTCSPYASCNISALYPNGSFILKDFNMTNKGDGMPNATLPNSNTSGTYTARYTCTQTGYSDSEPFKFLINPAGDELTTAQGILYIFFLVMVLIVFGFTLYGAIKIPWRNRRDDSGKVISINDLKWVKFACMCFVYLEMLLLTTITHKLIEGYLILEGVSGFFSIVHRILLVCLLPATIIVPWIILILIVADRKTKKLIQRGLPMR